MRRRGWRIGLGLTLATMVPAMAPAAGIYTYVDGAGTLHFSNAPADSRFRPGVPGAGDRSPVDPARYDAMIRAAARRHQVDPLLVKAVIEVESHFDRWAVSGRGARGLMQLMPETALELGVADPFEPAANILAGTRYLRLLLDRFRGDLALVLAAYNAGPSQVNRYGGMPPYQETRRYVRQVLRAYQRLTMASSPAKRWVRVAYE